MPIFVEIVPVVLEKMKMWNVYDKANADDYDNDDGQRKMFDQKSSLEPSDVLKIYLISKFY